MFALVTLQEHCNPQYKCHNMISVDYSVYAVTMITLRDFVISGNVSLTPVDLVTAEASLQQQ